MIYFKNTRNPHGAPAHEYQPNSVNECWDTVNAVNIIQDRVS